MPSRHGVFSFSQMPLTQTSLPSLIAFRLIISRFRSFIKVKRRICSKTYLLDIKVEDPTPYSVRIAYGARKCPGKLVKTSRGIPYQPMT